MHSKIVCLPQTDDDDEENHLKEVGELAPSGRSLLPAAAQFNSPRESDMNTRHV
jgi:hypothetical protein